MFAKSEENSLILNNLLVYSLTHALIDASCAAIIASNIIFGKDNLSQISFYIVLYNTIAFAFQVPIGLIIDKIKKPAEAAAIGCALVFIGVVTYKTSLFALIIAGFGNALFHVGGGVISLKLKEGKASLVGIFVAPGAIGLLAGTLFGKSNYFSILPILLLLITAAIFILLIKKPSINYKPEIKKCYHKFNVILYCVLASIAIRGLVGFMLTYSWKKNILLLIMFTFAVTLGKAIGGILGDIFGWRRVTIFGLLISAPLLALGMNSPYVAILGIFLFNLTMPITLTVVANILIGQMGFAFGLTTLALIIGSLPAFTYLRTILCENNQWIIFGAVILMALILWIGLNSYFSQEKTTHLSRQSF